MPKRWHINATLLLFLPPCGKFVPPLWHINATLHLFLPPIEIGGKIFAGRSARCPWQIYFNLILSEVY